MLDLFAMLKKGHCDGIKVRLGRLQNLLASSCLGTFYNEITTAYILFFRFFLIGYIYHYIIEHLDFTNNVETNYFDFQSFKQLANDYSGYQSLTDVPKSSVYTEDTINIEVPNYDCF